jgi:hypothetical protein
MQFMPEYSHAIFTKWHDRLNQHQIFGSPQFFLFAQRYLSATEPHKSGVDGHLNAQHAYL